MFRRNSTESEKSAAPITAADVDAAEGASRPSGKGRPTPTRKEAEAAARARAKPARSRKELAARDRARRVEQQKTAREAMKSGDERYFPARDRGAKRRLVRDIVDSRFGFTELTLPLMVLSLVMQYSGNSQLASTGVLIFLMLFVLVILDVIWLRFRVRRELRKRFGDDAVKGQLFYAVSRSMQLKFWRLPKPRVKIGAPLPGDYEER